MTRKPRVHYVDAIYHVIVRGNNREHVFTLDEQKRKYLNILAHYKEQYPFQLFCYVIMANHAHLLVQVIDTPLSIIMQGIQLRYTKFYNWHYHHTGHVFEQRYKAFLCEDENYLLTLVCYIHQNPIRAKIPDGFAYPWTSHRAYHIGFSNLVDISFILDILHSDRATAIKQYLSMVGAPIIMPSYKTECIDICQKPALKKENPSPPQTWERLVIQITSEYQVKPEQLLGKCRIRDVATARRRLVYEAINHNLFSKQQLAKKLQLDPSRITQLFREFEQSLLSNNSIFEITQA